MENAIIITRLQGSPIARRRAFAQARIVVGSSPDSDFVVDDPEVAGAHCRVDWNEREPRLVDLSRNGTFLHGVRVYEIALPPIARVALGRSVIEVRQRSPAARIDPFEQIVTRSPGMRRVMRILRRVARSQSSVVLEGEPGTGRRLLGAILHEASDRAAAPYLSIDGSESVEPLTRALSAARGGTLFIHHIDALAPEAQPLLRAALEDRVLPSADGGGSTPVDIRLVASAQRPLQEAVAAGRLRPDLFYCIDVVRVRVLPLRERPEDVRPLLEHLIRSRSAPGAPLDLASVDWDAVARAPYSGNVADLAALAACAVGAEDPALLAPTRRALTLRR